MSKSGDKSRVLGDDPLAWLSAGTDADKKPAKTELMSKNKKSKKSKLEKKIKADKVKIEAEKPKSEPPKVEQTKVDTKEKVNRLVLESSLVINKASDVYASLEKLSAGEGAVEIDASKVEIIDSAILQLLFAFVLSLKASGVSFSWYQPSDGMLNKAAILGLTEQLGL